MSLIRRTSWAVLASTALVAGCSSEDSTAISPATTTPATTATGKSQDYTPPEVLPQADRTLGDKKDETSKGDMPKIEGPRTDPPKDDAKKDGAPKADASKLSDKEVAAIHQLPADEQDAATRQLVCPVSEKHLGSMGKPIKISAEGKTFYLCCDGCKDDVEKDPKAVVAKLAKAK